MAAPAFRIAIEDPASGLYARLVLDDLTLGPAAGGIRTAQYATDDDAWSDALSLARAMTLKNALAGLTAGGGKGVVRAERLIDRERAFSILGERIETLGGIFRTAGDYGTTQADLDAMATRCRYVHTKVSDLAGSVASGLVGCLEAAFAWRKEEGMSGRTIAVQGAGAIGSAVVTALCERGAKVFVADVDTAKAEALASRSGAAVLAPETLLTTECDALCPCARGGVITVDVADAMRARYLCAGANNAIAGEAAEHRLVERGVAIVPDVIASAGAVADGIGESVMRLADRSALIAGLATTAAEVLERSASNAELPSRVAEAIARERIAAQRS